MRKWLPLLAVCLGTFMLLVDVTIVNVALPAMALDLHTSFASLQWVVDAYALALAALVLGTGSIADLTGHRRVYIAGLIVFAVSSLACGLAPNVAVLITARAVQGVGAAAMFATTIALLNSSYTGRDRGTAYGLWGATAGASAAIGPVVGGFLTEGVSWRWIFFVNLPVSLFAIALCVFVLADAHEKVQRRVDLAGMLTFTGAAGLSTFALIRANDHGWASGQTLGLLAAAAVLLALFVAVEARSKQPMLDMALMRNRSFVGVLAAALLVNFAAFAFLAYTSIWLQSVLGLSPIQAGLTSLPLSIASFTVAAVIGRFLHGARPGPIIGTGLVLVGLGGVLGWVFVRGGASWPALAPGYLVIGIGVGVATPTLSSAALAAVPRERGGMAAGAVNTARQLGYAFGIALLGTVFASRARSTIADHKVPSSARVARALAGGQAQHVLSSVPSGARSALDRVLHVASVDGVQATLVVSALAGLAGAALVFAMVRPAAVVAEVADPSQVSDPAEVPDPATL